jgi:O-antigen/teichoic acid export membrane protein
VRSRDLEAEQEMTGEAGGATSSQAADDGPVGRRVFTNFSFLFAAQAVAALAGLVSTAWLARALGAEAYGILGFGTAILAYFGLAVLVGTDVYGMREIAQNAGAAAAVVRRVLGLRTTSLAIALLAYLFTVRALGFDDRMRLVLWIQGFGLIVTAFTLDFVFQGVQRMGPVAARQAMASLLSLGGVLLLIRDPGDVYLAAGIPVAAIGLSAVWLAVRMHRRLTPVALSFDAAAWRPILVAVFPIVIAQGVNAIYTQMDILMLGLMAGGTETGVYVGMTRLYAMAILVGGLLATAFSPALAGAWPDSAAMRARYREFLTVCIFVGAPISAVAILWSGDIVAIVFGTEFLVGRDSLVLLMVTALLSYATFPVAAALVVWHDQMAQMQLMAAGGGLNILLNFLLIPRYGIEGAAAATLVSQAFLLAALVARLRTRFRLWELATPAKLVLVALVVFGALALSLAAGIVVPGPAWLVFAVHAGAGCVLYLAVAAATGLVRPDRLVRLVRGTRDGVSS